MVKTATRNCYIEQTYFSNTVLTIDEDKMIEGDDISIICELKKKNISSIWFKDGNQLKSTDKPDTIVNERKHILKINNAKTIDSGNYCIEVKGVKRKMYLKVKDYFHDPLSVNPIKPLEGDDVIISCEIKKKDVTVNWYKDENLLLSTDKPIKIENERKHTLKISKAEPMDSGYYCIEVEGVKRKIFVKVEDYFHDSLSINPLKPLEGDDVTISCEIKKKDVTVNWYKDERLLLSKDKPIKIENKRKHTLKIPKAEPIDSGDYCIEVEGVKRKILVQVEAFFINTPPDNITCVEGQPVSLQYTLLMYRFPLVYTRNDIVVENETHITELESGSSRKLMIQNTTPNDEGEYCLEVPGIKSKPTKLIVKALFKRPLRNVTVLKGFETIFECETEEENSPVEWFKDGKKVKHHTENLRMESLPGYIYKLTISQTKLSDGGTYSIKKKDVHSECVLKVKEKKGRRACHNCLNISVYSCVGCSKELCMNCSLIHKEENKDHSILPISESYILSSQFSLPDTVSLIRDIKCLPNGVLVVIADAYCMQLLICSISGEDRHFISLNGYPNKIAVVDRNTIAVSVKNFPDSLFSVHIVNIQQGRVTSILNNKSQSSTIIYIENQLYVVGDLHIVVMDMQGTIKRRIKLQFTPNDMCYDFGSRRIYCVDKDHNKLICIDKDGNSIFTFTDSNIEYPDCLAIDNEGNILMLCRNRDYSFTICVIEVDSNGKSSEVVITNIDKSSMSCICFDRYSNSVVTGFSNTLNMYTKEAKV